MAENSKIEWCDHTFNPWMGCTKVSAGCKNCYAENQMDHRWNKVQWGPGKPRVRTSDAMWKKPLQWNAAAAQAGTRPKVFCASLADWLDPSAPIEWLTDLLALIQATPNLDWLLVTKRPELFRERMEHVFGFEIYKNPTATTGRLQLAWDWHHGKMVPANVWFGVSVEHQEAADARIPVLLQIPARVRFLSCEPLLGPVDLCRWYEHKSGEACVHPLDGYVSSDGFYQPWLDKDSRIHWVICGGESGPNARPMHPDWARGLRDQCNAAGVPFFFKQWGEWWPGGKRILENTRVVNFGAEPMWHVGKKNAGRLLDGREWNDVPVSALGGQL